MTDKVPISLVQARGCACVPLVFSITAVKRLRDLGVAGILTGTLPSATQQNAFLGIPLRLMLEEAIWLVEKGFAYFVCDGELLKEAISDLSSEDFAEMQRKSELSFEEQRLFKRQHHAEKLHRLGVTVPGTSEGDERLLESSLFVEIENESELIKKEEVRFDSDVFQKKLVESLLKGSNCEDDYYIFKSLKEQGYFLSPGGRFGGRFIAYPGDPLRYHSHMTVQKAMDYYNEPIDLLQLVSGGRLGTGVKKLWVIGGVREGVREGREEDVAFFSVEWAGFG